MKKVDHKKTLGIVFSELRLYNQIKEYIFFEAPASTSTVINTVINENVSLCEAFQRRFIFNSIFFSSKVIYLDGNTLTSSNLCKLGKGTCQIAVCCV